MGDSGAPVADGGEGRGGKHQGEGGPVPVVWKDVVLHQHGEAPEELQGVDQGEGGRLPVVWKDAVLHQHGEAPEEVQGVDQGEGSPVPVVWKDDVLHQHGEAPEEVQGVVWTRERAAQCQLCGRKLSYTNMARHQRRCRVWTKEVGQEPDEGRLATKERNGCV